MKKISKILIILITIFMLVLSTIINGSKVEASWQYKDQLQPVDTSLPAAAAQQGTTDGSGLKELKKKDPKKIINLEKKSEVLGTKKLGEKKDTLPQPKTAEDIKEIRETGEEIRENVENAESNEDEAEDENDGLGKPTILKLITGALDGIVGILFWLPKMLLLVTLYTAASIIGAMLGGDFSIESIIFNQAIENPIGLISVNFFDKTGGNNDKTNDLIQENIATWYIAIRNIAITILVIVAMYIAIRMLLATTSEKKAQYKEILIYWVQSLALIFVLHYIMIGIIAINDALVKALYKAGEQVV